MSSLPTAARWKDWRTVRIWPKRTASRSEGRVRALYEAEARRALLLSVMLRFGVLIVFYLIDFEPGDSPAERRMDALVHLAFAPVGLCQLIMVWRKLDWAWPKYVFIAVDITMLMTLSLMPWPDDTMVRQYPALVSREPTFVYGFLLLLFSILYFSPWALVWFAGCILIAWATVVSYLVQLPGVVTEVDLHDDMTDLDQLLFMLRPEYLELERWSQEAVILMIVAVGAAFVVARMRRVALQAARIERQRGNLSRYFSPTVIDSLASRDVPLGDADQIAAAVLFADLRDYSSLTEDLPATDVLAVLREFHGAMERQIFAFGGTLEKYIGDAVMATFGTPRAGSHDCCHAICCAQAMFAALDDLNADRRARGLPPLGMGIGLHYGSLVMGDIGNDRNMAFVTVGSAVNLASRIQGLTRTIGCDIVISADFETGLRREASDAARVLTAGFAEPVMHDVKGFGQAVQVRSLRLQDWSGIELGEKERPARRA